MIIRVIRWAVENVIDVQEITVSPENALVVIETMADIRLRVVKEYELAPAIYEEPHE